LNSAIMFLEKTANIDGNRIAVVSGEECITYTDLRSKARKVGSTLLKKCPKIPCQINPVLVLLPKGINALISFMGILYSGNPYVPLDYSIPHSRLGKIMENLSPKYIITDSQGYDRLNQLDLGKTELLLYDDMVSEEADDMRVDGAIAAVADAEPIYIMYTSGSTGVPKGVVIPHRGVIDYAEWVTKTFDITKDTVMGNQSAFYFDNSVLDIYGAFSVGAKLVIIPETLFMFPLKIPEYINSVGITSVFFVPTVMINIANSGVLEKEKMPTLNQILFCGETMPNRQLNIWRHNHPNARYANLYGPTEITDVCTYYIVDRGFEDDEPLPIGKACKNMNVLILTDENKAAKTNEMGELCVLGSGLALGYWCAEEITRRVFVQNPLNNSYDERMYRTGDIVFWAEDGLISFVGRKDSQIKLKGNRIELGEIETAVKSIDNIENACILFDVKAQQIVAFVQTSDKPTLRALNQLLMKIIPKYMLPSRLEIMEELPQTPNGKIDRVRLKGTFE